MGVLVVQNLQRSKEFAGLSSQTSGSDSGKDNTQPNRNFATYPVTSEEDLQLSRQDTFDFSAAVCHPTIHGNVTSMDRFFGFVSYYRLLGFDHVFMWYLKESISTTPEVWHDFNRLANLSYVTMTEFENDDNNTKYYGQREVQTACLSEPHFAGSYDWALVVDADEFLWFHQNMTVKDFLSRQNYTYYSFGKWQYSRQSAVALPETEDAGFGLDRYAFTPGFYCYLERGNQYCPDWRGRCKFLTKPSLYPISAPHGDSEVLLHPKSVHFSHRKAHIKEWPGYISVGARTETSTIVRDRSPWVAKSNDEVGVHDLERSFRQLRNGAYPIVYDTKLAYWTRYVASQLPRCEVRQ